MSLEALLDERGRITIPKEIRERFKLRSGDRLIIKVEGDNIIITRARDPYEIIESILGDLTFERRLRKEAERQLLKELGTRYI